MFNIGDKVRVLDTLYQTGTDKEDPLCVEDEANRSFLIDKVGTITEIASRFYEVQFVQSMPFDLSFGFTNSILLLKEEMEKVEEE